MIQKISIIIVNYNSGGYLLGCLSSIAKNVAVDYEAIIVDNDSKDNSFENCKSEFKKNDKFKFIQSGENCGFSKGNIIGVSYANGSVYHFLNPDTEVNSDINNDYIEVLNNQDFVYINPLRNPDGKLVKSEHIIPTIGNYFLSIFNKNKKWYIGASVIISKENYLKIGGWNKDFWMYYEDLDFFYRINRQNIEIKLLPSIIEHIGGGCSSNVWTNKERLKVVQKAERDFYKHNGLTYQYPVIKFINHMWNILKKMSQ